MPSSSRASTSSHTASETDDEQPLFRHRSRPASSPRMVPSSPTESPAPSRAPSARAGPSTPRTPSARRRPRDDAQDFVIVSSDDEEEERRPSARRRIHIGSIPSQHSGEATGDGEEDSFVIARVVRRTPDAISILDDDDSDSASVSDHLDDLQAARATALEPVSSSPRTRRSLAGAAATRPRRSMRRQANAQLQPVTSHSPEPATVPRPTLQVTPPRTEPPPLAYPMVSTFTCPICFCAPEDAVAAPCGHVFCSACLFAALQTEFVRDRPPPLVHLVAPWLRSNPPVGGLRRAQGGGGGGGSGGQGTRSNAAQQQGQGQESDDLPLAKFEPLPGKCPVCRTNIEGGFIRPDLVHPTRSTRTSARRSVLGLVFKTGKPIDDPRRQEPGASKA